MPFDSSPDFVLPAVETDEALRMLLAAREWLSDPSHWSKGTYYRDANGAMIEDFDAPMVVGSTCAWGALYHANGLRLLAREGLAAEATLFAAGHVPTINDRPETTHADILALYDRAIAARRAEIGG